MLNATNGMLTVMSFKLFVAYLLVVVVSPEQLLMELCVIDGDDEAVDIGEDGTPPKSAVSSGLAFNTRLWSACGTKHKFRTNKRVSNIHCGNLGVLIFWATCHTADTLTPTERGT